MRTSNIGNPQAISGLRSINGPGRSASKFSGCWAKHSFGPWLTAAANRLHHNVLATALANKLARIAWIVLMQARSYEARVN